MKGLAAKYTTAKQTKQAMPARPIGGGLCSVGVLWFVPLIKLYFTQTQYRIRASSLENHGAIFCLNLKRVHP